METNKRYILAALCFTGFLTLSVGACKGKHSRVTVENEEPPAEGRILSTVRMGDSKASAQLLTGFWAVEANSWRWTARNFSVLLRTPPTAAQRGGTLNLAFTIPDVIVQKLKNITIAASINGMTLKSAEYHSAGAFVFSADVPASMLTSESVRIDFTLDKSLPPGAGDQRELGIVANSVSIGPR